MDVGQIGEVSNWEVVRVAVEGVGTIAMSVMGFLVRGLQQADNALRQELGAAVATLSRDHDTLREGVSRMERELPERYARRDDLRDGLQSVEGMLHQILAKLDLKADKDD